jgi:hypothetical protein
MFDPIRQDRSPASRLAPSGVPAPSPLCSSRPSAAPPIFLGDVPAAMTAILDRFLAHATIVQVTGKSYRLRQRASTTGD